MKFYRCKHCGNIVAYIHDSGVRVRCCGEEMEEIFPNTTDAAGEKHVPVIRTEGQTVTVEVGSMLETKEGRQRKTLRPGEKPVAKFSLVPGDEVVAAYEYCNLHGLWKAE